MPLAGIIWASIICIPFGLIVILVVNEGVCAIETIIFVGLVSSGLLLLFILPSPPKNGTGQIRQATVQSGNKGSLYI